MPPRNSDQHGPSPQSPARNHYLPAPEEMSLQGTPRIGDVMREIGLCVAIALGLALLATIYAYVRGA